jgi:hypothetical protein
LGVSDSGACDDDQSSVVSSPSNCWSGVSFVQSVTGDDPVTARVPVTVSDPTPEEATSVENEPVTEALVEVVDSVSGCAAVRSVVACPRFAMSPSITSFIEPAGMVPKGRRAHTHRRVLEYQQLRDDGPRAARAG